MSDEQTLEQIESLRKQTESDAQIGDKEALLGGDFTKEFDNNEAYISKLRSLSDKKFSLVRRCRRDGNCFYRCVLFALFEKMINSDDAFRKHLETKVSNVISHCEKAGYDKFAFEDMQEAVVELLQESFGGFSSNEGKKTPTIAQVESLFRADDMNYPLCWLRCITSSVMKNDKDSFLPFLDGKTVEEFCMSEIDPLYREADQPQIQALCQYLGVPLRIFYLDQSAGENCTVYFMNEDAVCGLDSPINLLYRPGHYELLYQD